MSTLYIDYSKCIGCETCEQICAFMYGKANIVMSRTEDGRNVPLYCRHCNNPGCAKACTREAIVKTEEGVVLLQPALCEGCTTKDCLKGCPFLGIYPNAAVEGVPNKCDMCQKQQAKGLLPACVSMCPCHALQLKSEESDITQEAKTADKIVLQHIKAKKVQLFG